MIWARNSLKKDDTNVRGTGTTERRRNSKAKKPTSVLYVGAARPGEIQKHSRNQNVADPDRSHPVLTSLGWLRNNTLTDYHAWCTSGGV
jgi:hypothetical protein